MSPYQALLLVSFGGPEKAEDVIPFLEQVTAGRGVPAQRLYAVAKHYYAHGGASPINAQCRAMLANLDAAMGGTGLRLYWGNRNWHPFLAATVAQMRDDGIEAALALVTSAYGGYSSCRQYLEDIASARAAAGAAAPVIDKLRLYYNHPGWASGWAESLRRALASVPVGAGPTSVLFSAHSIPEEMARTSPYVAHVRETARLVAEQAGVDGWQLVWQSRSGSPAQPWLGPDITEVIAGTTARAVVVAPIGFVCDNMEIVHDLDVEAAGAASQKGIFMARAETIGTTAGYATMARRLVDERLAPQAGEGGGATVPQRLALAPDGPWPDHCPPGHCPSAAELRQHARDRLGE